MFNKNLIAHLRLGVSRNKEPNIKTLEQRMEEDYIELIGSWSVAKDKMERIDKIICYCGNQRYIAPVRKIIIKDGIKLAYLDHDRAKFQEFNKNYGIQIGHKRLGINKFYTDLEEKPI